METCFLGTLGTENAIYNGSSTEKEQAKRKFKGEKIHISRMQYTNWKKKEQAESKFKAGKLHILIM